MKNTSRSERSKIEILVVNHKASFVPDNELLKPIQVGAALRENRLADVVYYDDTGDNISQKNRSYCELTATYWAWKNLEADYYGLFHYRRYLSFAPDSSNNPFPGKAYANIPSSLDELRINEEDMRRTIEGYDLIVPRKDDTKATTGEPSLYGQYANEHYIKDLDYCVEYIKKFHPDISPYLSTLQDSRAYFCNMFIMKRGIFNEYCSFLFDVLDSFEASNDISNYSPQQYRVTGYIAERLTNVFIHYLIGTGKYKVKELQIAYFENTEPIMEISPISKDNNIGIVLAADNGYVPYISTLIGSLVRFASSDYVYDINILHKSITSQNQQLLKSEFMDRNNIHIRFFDMNSRLAGIDTLATKWHITVETYFRLFIPEIMKTYDKVLYLDGDLIIKRDVAELYREEVGGYMLAACRDVDMAGVYSSNLVPADNTINPNIKHHLDNNVKLNSPYDYFQAGVLVLNLEEIRSAYTTEELIAIASNRNWEYLDQDVLNYIARGRVKFLDLRWNVLYDWEFRRIEEVISKAPVWLYDDYIHSRKDAFIIHFGGTVKPWQRVDADFAQEFWRVARQSLFYEIIIDRMCAWSIERRKSGHNGQGYVAFRARTVRGIRKVVDLLAPKGTLRRKPIVLTGRMLKRLGL